MRISDWSSDVCSSDLPVGIPLVARHHRTVVERLFRARPQGLDVGQERRVFLIGGHRSPPLIAILKQADGGATSDCRQGSSLCGIGNPRSEEHTSELQSLMRISYAVFCLKKKKNPHMKN